MERVRPERTGWRMWPPSQWTCDDLPQIGYRGCNSPWRKISSPVQCPRFLLFSSEDVVVGLTAYSPMEEAVICKLSELGLSDLGLHWWCACGVKESGQTSVNTGKVRFCGVKESGQTSVNTGKVRFCGVKESGQTSVNTGKKRKILWRKGKRTDEREHWKET